MDIKFKNTLRYIAGARYQVQKLGPYDIRALTDAKFPTVVYWPKVLMENGYKV